MNTRPKVCGVGTYVRGKYVASQVVANNKSAPTQEYRLWHNMLRRCYGSEVSKGYESCTVREEFLNFQSFMLWCETQTGYGCRGFCLDKDLLVPGNLEYAPDKCLFLPLEINLSLVNSKKASGVWQEAGGRWRAQFCKLGRNGHVGRFDTREEAMSAYSKVKTDWMGQLGNKWRSQIDPRAYEALMNYEVLITD